MLVMEKELSRIERICDFHVSFESKVTPQYLKKGTVVRKSLLNGILATEGLNDLKVKRTDMHLCGANKRYTVKPFYSGHLRDRKNRPLFGGVRFWGAVSYTHLTLPTIYSV